MDLLSFPDTFWNSWDAAWDDEERKPQDELVLPRRTCEASRSHGISFTSADTQLLLNESEKEHAGITRSVNDKLGDDEETSLLTFFPVDHPVQLSKEALICILDRASKHSSDHRHDTDDTKQGEIPSLPHALIRKLYTIVGRGENIQWNLSGDHFVITNEAQFVLVTMPQIFRGTYANLIKFLTQDFSFSISSVVPDPTNGQQLTFYCHRCFRRNRPELLSQIQRYGGTNNPKKKPAEKRVGTTSTKKSMTKYCMSTTSDVPFQIQIQELDKVVSPESPMASQVTNESAKKLKLTHILSTGEKQQPLELFEDKLEEDLIFLESMSHSIVLSQTLGMHG